MYLSRLHGDLDCQVPRPMPSVGSVSCERGGAGHGEYWPPFPPCGSCVLQLLLVAEVVKLLDPHVLYLIYCTRGLIQ